MFEFFIAKRYLRSKHRINLISVISILSTLGVMIGVAALVIVLSVFNGFGSIVQSILINFDPHVKITLTSEEAYKNLTALENKLNSIEYISSHSPFVEGKTILWNKNIYEILDLKGIEHEGKDESWGVNSAIISGEFDLEKSGLDKMIVGFPIALRLSCRVGDTISVTSFKNLEKSALFLSMPESKRFIVSGIFETNNKNYDYKFVYTSLEAGQDLFGLDGNVSGYEVRLSDIDYSEKVKKEILKSSDANLFSVYTWYDLHEDLYTVMLIERWAAYIILCLIIAVATFNILGSLTMSVIEKKKDIGVLKSIGVNDNSILKIFMFEGLLIGLIGTLTGLIIGLAVCYLQINFNFYPLDPTKYIIDALPVEVRFFDIIAIAGMSILLSFLASLYPAKRAVKQSIIEAIKWE
ncbi:MAG: ABC transporter permease [Melioribacteraceae bacterium]|nr:ABC transporter permease [Melioribacteraceae bacterium]MCF8355648.1 ABC transporter permease [Melioribacteraceae bacterium]MCF8394652.1 ABC transporter permease [Melioribacteraceae bacterium]MCF8418014.1 ABC transporter permease [Melioribacteraceae bacterium]